jgi:hypothetical protein
MAVHDYDDLRIHVGHAIQCVTYGADAENVALECTDCNEVLLDYDCPAGSDATAERARR